MLPRCSLGARNRPCSTTSRQSVDSGSWAKSGCAPLIKTIEAGETPPEFKRFAGAPIAGSWLAEEPFAAGASLHELLEFSADGSGTQALLFQEQKKYRVVDGKLMTLNPVTGKEVTEHLEFDKEALVIELNARGALPTQKLRLTRLGAGKNPKTLVGTWTGKSHVEDLGDAVISVTFDSNQAGTMTFETRMPNPLHFTYTLEGKNLKYMLNGRHEEATCQLAGDRLILTGFSTARDDKPHAFRRLPATAK